MELEKIKRVENTCSVEIVNLYLEKGWILIATASPQGDRTSFTIGWKENAEPIYPKFIKAWREKELSSDLYGDFMTEESAYFYYSEFQVN